MADKPEVIFYIAGTHWDREWYKSFQEFRFRLVETIDGLLKVLNSQEEFSTFTLDGQTALLEDFEQIEPEKSGQLRKFLHSGRLLAGPWYTMPDEFLTSGESLVANLLAGHETARRFGADEAMKCGYLCDVFGHIAQMPQILNGFGIHSAVLGRGTNDASCKAFFLWESPDGSRCCTFKVPEEYGYGTFWYEVLNDFLTGKNPDRNALVERAYAYIERELARSPVPVVMLMDAMDHQAVHEIAPWVCKELGKRYGCPVVIAGPDAFESRIMCASDKLEVRQGELTETAMRLVEHNRLISGTLSSRCDIKLDNDKTQALLEKWALPLAAVSALHGKPVQHTYLKLARRYLFQNQAHDSICGCSADRVHRDMAYRFRQAQQIAGEIPSYALSSLMSLKEMDKSGDFRLVVVNPLCYPLCQTQLVQLFFPPDFPTKLDEQIPSEKINNFKILDENGAEIPYTIARIRRGTFQELPRCLYPQPADLYEIYMAVDIPAMAVHAYRVIPCEKPVRYFGTLLTGNSTAENRMVTLHIHSDGTVMLRDKRNGRVYRHLCSFEDDGEIGDGWYHMAPFPDRAVRSRGCAVSIEKVLDGPNVCTFRIGQTLSVPRTARYDRSYTSRSEEMAPLSVSTDFTLTDTSPWVDCVTRVDNTVSDHRLRLIVPTGVAGKKYFADQAFAFVCRATGVRKETETWKESEKAEKAFSHIVYRAGPDGNGLAFLSKGGMHECAALDDLDGTLAVTLFRSFSKTFLNGNEPDGELLRPLRFEYRLFPLDGIRHPATLVRAKDFYTAGIRAYSVQDCHALSVPEIRLGFSLTGEDLVVTCVKPPENQEQCEIILRVVNYAGSPAEGTLSCPADVEAVWQANMLEEETGSLPFEGKTIRLVLRPYEIFTIRIRFRGNA